MSHKTCNITTFDTSNLTLRSTTRHNCLKHCVTKRKAADSIPSSVDGIFHRHNSSSCIFALQSTQPLTEMTAWNISWEVAVVGDG